MSEQEPRPAGKIISKSNTRPAIKLGEMIWENIDASANWTRGPIKTPRARPSIRLEWSDEPVAEPTLELTLRPDPSAQAIDLALGIIDLIASVSSLDRWLGGGGLKKSGGGQTNGTLTITLTGDARNGTADRMRWICEECNRTDGSGTRFVLPASVQSIEARVA